MYMIREELTAWAFDRAVTTFGNALESRLQEVAKSAKKQKVAEQRQNSELMKWLSSNDPEGTVAKGRFRDPMSR